MRKTSTMGSPICSGVTFRTGSSDKGKGTYASSSMQDNKFVYWNAFTTMKLPSTSHAAKMKSEDRSEEANRTDVPLTFPAIAEHHLAPA